LHKIDKRSLEIIEEIEEACFPEQMQSNIDDLGKTLESKGGFRLF